MFPSRWSDSNQVGVKLVMLSRNISLLIAAMMVTLVTMLFAGSATALQADYVDIDNVGTWLESGDSVSGNFNIMLGEGDDFGAGENLADVDGFDPLLEDIYAARVSFLFFDLDFEAEGIEIDLTGLVGEENITTQVLFVKLLTINVEFEVLASLNENGELDWSITADPNVQGNDFYVSLARLEGFAAAGSTTEGGSGSPMPEPGSTALLAVGTLLVARAGRSRRR
jgi:hypothetical protein